MRIRSLVKCSLHSMAVVIVLPMVSICRLEFYLSDRKSRRFFIACGQFVALLPGFSGHLLRRAFYCGTLKSCTSDCKIGFGVIFSQPDTEVQSNVFIGTYALIGTALLCRGCLIGSRASIISSGHSHSRNSDGSWMPFENAKVSTTIIGANAWIGEAALIAANVGENSHVSAGAVVGSPVPANVMMAGNPARFVRNLGLDDD